MEKAIEWLREKGLAGAAKKAGRIAAEGVVGSAMCSEDATVGVIVRSQLRDRLRGQDRQLQELSATMSPSTSRKANPADVDELLAQKFVDDESKTIDRPGERARPLPSARRSPSAASPASRPTTAHGGHLYPHGRQDRRAGGGQERQSRYLLRDAFKAFYHDVALQIAAAKPYAMSASDEVPSESLNKEK